MLGNIRIDIAEDFQPGGKNETVMKYGLAILVVGEPKKIKMNF